ncbi:hypothetical protein BD309DRAFT_987365 [Dichomitus squalens]|nr:hypothetical protein BD309DRAFT_987365 [Dichomitus squalens]
MAPSVHVDDDVDAADDTSPSLRGRLEVSTAAPQVDQLSVAWPGKASSFPASPACSTPTELEGQSGDSEELGAGSGLLTFVQGDDDLPPVVLKAKGRAATYSLSGVRKYVA